MHHLANAGKLFGFSFIARLLYMAAAPPAELKQLPMQIDRRANILLDGGTHHFPDAWASFYQIVAGFYTAFDFLGVPEQDYVHAFLVVQMVMASIAVSVVYLLAVRLFGNERWAFWGAVLFAIYYPFLYLNSLILSETFFTMGVVAGLTLLLAPNRRIWMAAMAGLLLGLAFISRPILTTFMPLLLIWVLVTTPRGERILDSVALFAPIIAIVMVSSWLTSTIDKNSRFSYNGNTGINVAMTQCRIKRIEYSLEDGEGFWFAPPYFWDGDGPEIETDVAFYDNGYYMQMGLDCVLDAPINVMVGNIRHVANVFDSELYPNNNETITHVFLLLVWKIITIAFALLALFFPLTRAYKERPIARSGFWLFAGLVAGMFASVYLASPGEERYVIPFFFVFVLFGIPVIDDGLALVLDQLPIKEPPTTPDAPA